jgi:hypothetical protein
MSGYVGLTVRPGGLVAVDLAGRHQSVAPRDQRRPVDWAEDLLGPAADGGGRQSLVSPVRSNENPLP